MSKRDRTVAAVLPPFQQKSVRIFMADLFSRLPCQFDYLLVTPLSLECILSYGMLGARLMGRRVDRSQEAPSSKQRYLLLEINL